MPPITQGNLAVKPLKDQRVKVRETTRVVYRKKAISTQEKLLYLFTIAVCVAVAAVIIWRYAQIYEMNMKIQDIDRQVSQLQTENQKLKNKVETLSDPKNLEKRATQLGFVKDYNGDGQVDITETGEGSNVASNQR